MFYGKTQTYVTAGNKPLTKPTQLTQIILTVKEMMHTNSVF